MGAFEGVTFGYTQMSWLSCCHYEQTETILAKNIRNHII